MTDPCALLVIGGGPAGFSAVKAYRELRQDGVVAIVTDEQLMPYERPALTKEFLRGEVSADQLPLEDESWLLDNKVHLISGRAVDIDPDGQIVKLSGGRTVSYDNCVIATGAEPKRLPIPGADHPSVRVVRSLQDVRLLLERLDGGKQVAVIGSGFIGCEIASSLRARRHKVDLLSDEKAPNAERLGDEAATFLAAWLHADGVELHLGNAVERVEHSKAKTRVTAGNREISTDLIVMACGVTPRSELAELGGVEVRDGAVTVDASMRTSRENLFAVGDVCVAENRVAGRPLRVEHWGDALAQGEIAGRFVAGDLNAAWDSVPGFWSTIGTRTLKYAAWGDGFDQVTVNRHPGGGFTCWYNASDRLVGVLSHEADEDYERGQALIKEAAT